MASIWASAVVLSMDMASPAVLSKPEYPGLRFLLRSDDFKRGLDEGFLPPVTLHPVGADDLAARRVGIHGHRRAASPGADRIALIELLHRLAFQIWYRVLGSGYCNRQY